MLYHPFLGYKKSFSRLWHFHRPACSPPLNSNTVIFKNRDITCKLRKVLSDFRRRTSTMHFWKPFQVFLYFIGFTSAGNKFYFVHAMVLYNCQEFAFFRRCFFFLFFLDSSQSPNRCFSFYLGQGMFDNLQYQTLHWFKFYFRFKVKISKCKKFSRLSNSWTCRKTENWLKTQN